MKMENWKLEIGVVDGRWSMVNSRGWVYYMAVFFSILFLPSLLKAQSEERKLIRDGNKLYKEKKFSDAEVKYKKSLNLNKNSVPGTYNLGNAYYKQGKFDEASQQYQSIFSDKNASDAQKAQAYHNIGNSLLQEKKYPESIDAFKNSLKMNPKDNDTRYNLAYAQSMLQQQQKQQQQQNKDNKDNDKKNKDQTNKDQKNQQDKKEQDKDQQSKDQQKKDEQKQAQVKKQKISKEYAEKILQALNNDEKNAQKKLSKKETTRIQIEKTW